MDSYLLKNPRKRKEKEKVHHKYRLHQLYQRMVVQLGYLLPLSLEFYHTITPSTLPLPPPPSIN